MTNEDTVRAEADAWFEEQRKTAEALDAHDRHWIRAAWVAARVAPPAGVEAKRLVPIEPTQAMGVAGNRAQAHGASATVIYRHMLDASERAPEEPAGSSLEGDPNTHGQTGTGVAPGTQPATPTSTAVADKGGQSIAG